MSAPTKATSKIITQNVAKATRSPSIRAPPPFLKFVYEPDAKPINATTFTSTVSMLQNRSHPFHIKTKRVFDAFDPNILHWKVIVSVAVSKKAVVRNWAVQRVSKAIKAELKQRGYGRDGSVLDGHVGRMPLKGALAIRTTRDHRVLTATVAEVRTEAASVLDQVERLCRKATFQPRGVPMDEYGQRRPAPRSENWRQHPGHSKRSYEPMRPWG